MPPKSKKEILVLLINIGVTCPNMQNNSSLLEKTKHIGQKIIEKKIFLKPKDEIAVILMGSSITKNSLNTEHVEEFIDFQVPNWNLIEKIINLQGTNYCSNWIEALDATMWYIKQNDIDVSIRKVVLMSDFNEQDDIISQFEADIIAKKLCTENIQLITVVEESLDDRPESSLKISEVFLKNLYKKVNGQHLTFDDIISDLRFYEKPSTKPAPWYSTLELIDIKIPIVSYIKVTDTNKFPSWKLAKDGKKIIWETKYIDRQRNSYTLDEIVTGYKYGGVHIPVEKKLEETMSYKSGMRSYRIHSFTKKDIVELKYWYDNTTHIVLPSSREKAAAKPFYSLVQAMHNKNLIAIVRKVFNNDKAPRMVALFPCINIPDEPWCLVEVALPFAEDRRTIAIRPLKSVMKQLSSEQNETLDNLLDSLILPDTEDSCVEGKNQYFLPGCVPDPAVQHKWHMLSHRALNPNKPLPPMEDYLKELLEAPLVKDRSKQHLQRVAELFQLEEINPKIKQKDETKKENNMTNTNKISVGDSMKVDDKVDAKHDSIEEPDFSMDTSDIDLDELVANI